MEKKNLAILVFDDVEVLDFAGPFEVFSVTNELNDDRLLNVYTIGLTDAPVSARNGLTVVPDYAFSVCPAPDILVIPGGVGTRPLLEKPAVLDWIAHTARSCEHVLSVCTGSLVLAKAGLLNGLYATTHHSIFAELEALAPDTTVVRDRRFTDNGTIVTSAGVAAGIDMCLHMIGRLYGMEQARATARYIEYPMIEDPSPDTV